MNEMVFASKGTAETVALVFDFSGLSLQPNTLTSPVVTAAVYSGVDPAPASLISGSASVASSTGIIQKIAGGVAGCIYELTCTVTATSTGGVVQTAVVKGKLAVM